MATNKVEVKKYTESELKELLDNSWLNLGDTSKIHVDNPLQKETVFDIENPHVHLLNVIRNPDNFAFTCKHILNKTLLPFQLAILRELWFRPFPMLVGSRGLGKCVGKNTYIATDSGFCTIEELVGKDVPVLTQIKPLKDTFIIGENGHKKLEYCWKNSKEKTKKIVTRHGFELEGTYEHPIRVATENGIEWKNLCDVKDGDFAVIDRGSEFPKNPTSDLPTDLAYLLGMLVGDGGYTKQTEISFTTADEELANAAISISAKYWGKAFKKIRAKYQYVLYSKEHRTNLFTKYGFGSSVCAEKDFPTSVLNGSKDTIASFIRGLMDTDGCVYKQGGIEFCSKSKKLAYQLHFMLSRFGIISRVQAKLNKKYQRYYYYVNLFGKSAKKYSTEIGFGLTRKMNRLNEALSKNVNSNVDIIPSCLISKDLFSLRDKWTKIRPPEPHGYSYSRQIISKDRLSRYDLTYEHLGRLLELTKPLQNTQEWINLKHVFDKNIFFDKVVEISDGECETYDVYIPDDHSFISNGFVSHNSFILAVYSMLRALLCQGSKIVVVGASFRQSKIIFEYCDEIWRNAPVLRDFVGDNHGGMKNGPRRDIDRCTMRLGESLLIALPIGDGSKIRGQRANIILADEFASIPVEIFENVIAGFAAVSLSPVEKVKAALKEKAMIESGLYKTNENPLVIPGLNSNQTILTGTAYYSFNHFASYWKRWKAIVESKGDQKLLEEIFAGEVPNKFNWKDYSAIRLPVELLPPGFMDEKHVAKAKASIHPSQYLLEYAACFTGDSNGFYKRSLIEACVAGIPSNNISFPSCSNISFSACLKGNQQKRYIMGIDPASERDNFSIVILELWPDHRRIVHCWTTTRAKFKAKLKRGLVRDGQDDFYGFAARKIRDLIALFPCERICLDSQGGGVSVLEALGSLKNIIAGERPILQVVDHEKPKDTDNIPGDHIVEMINFASSDWVSFANHGMRQDFENKTLLFPCMDSAELGMAYEEDKVMGRVKITNGETQQIYDTLEDCVMEIEELKDELATIVHTQTGTTLRDRWDTPETKLPGNKKGRLRKDRYSALLMANAVARVYQAAPIGPRYSVMGGFAHEMNEIKQNPNTVSQHQNPDWYNEVVMSQGYGAVVNRR